MPEVHHVWQAMEQGETKSLGLPRQARSSGDQRSSRPAPPALSPSHAGAQSQAHPHPERRNTPSEFMDTYNDHVLVH
jgi:hypothetical protein